VGPLKPGRIIDLNERAMRFFDPSLQLGVIHEVKVRPLSGDSWVPGPVG
jgi:rare lipoprotein A